MMNLGAGDSSVVVLPIKLLSGDGLCRLGKILNG